MAEPTYQKVLCIDPCDPQATKYRYVSLLVQTEKPLRGAKASPSVLTGWKPEPTLVDPVRMIDEVDENTIARKIHVIDSKFGNQIVHYITPKEGPSPDHKIADMNIVTDRKIINKLWKHAVKAPVYSAGEARATPLPYKPGEVYMDGTRSDFALTFNMKYPINGDVPADDVPTYCNCQLKESDGSGGAMIQCSNGERYCLREWYHLKCIGMVKEDVPKGDWFCNDCVKDHLGKLKTIDYVQEEPKKGKVKMKEKKPNWKPKKPVQPRQIGLGVHLQRRMKGKKGVEKIGRAHAYAAAREAAKMRQAGIEGFDLDRGDNTDVLPSKLWV